MALLSPQLKQAIHTSSLSNKPLQPYSTSRPFTTIVHGSRPQDHETLSMSQTAPPLLSSGFAHVTHDADMNKLASPSQVVPDLPSWTPLRSLKDDESSSASDPEVDELATRRVTDSSVKQLVGPPTNARATVEITVTAGRSLKSSSDNKPSKGKRARFDGVFITRKPPPYRRFTNTRTQSGPASTSSVRTFNLMDALARTFDANRHTEVPVPRQPRPALRQHDAASTVPQTDVETTEAEDERLQLNTRLARVPLNRQRGRPRITAGSANASETNSEDAASLLQDVLQRERPVKRLKAIQYEANTALIDAALGTVQAPISWEDEMNIITREEDFVIPAQTAHVASTEVQMAVDEGHLPPSTASGPSSAQTPVVNAWPVLTWMGPKRTVLSPYLSRGAKFRQRLDATFGENAAVRTDKLARPRPADLDLFVPLDEPPSPSVSESTESAGSASTVEEVASAIPSTHVTSQSPDVPPADTNMAQLPSKPLDEADSPTGPAFSANEEEMNGWIAALQRLVKGKVRVKEGDLETLSIILAEVESVKDSLDQSVSMTSELRESVKQLSELHDIPFGDRNRLRLRAANIFRAWPSMGKPGAS